MIIQLILAYGIALLLNSKNLKFGKLIGEIFEKLCYNIIQS